VVRGGARFSSLAGGQVPHAPPSDALSASNGGGSTSSSLTGCCAQPALSAAGCKLQPLARSLPRSPCPASAPSPTLAPPPLAPALLLPSGAGEQGSLAPLPLAAASSLCCCRLEPATGSAALAGWATVSSVEGPPASGAGCAMALCPSLSSQRMAGSTIPSQICSARSACAAAWTKRGMEQASGPAG
jgi:hypothetical protein